MSVAFPAYIWPANNDTWTPLFDTIAANPTVPFDIIVNPSNGPNGTVPSPVYVASISRLNNYTNTNIFGYVHSSFGTRNVTAIISDISAYQAWTTYPNADIHVDGIFVDEAPTDLVYLDHMSTIYGHVKDTLTGSNTVWTNPGVPIDAAFYKVADLVNAYENSYDDWINNNGSNAIPKEQHSKSTVMIHSYDQNDKKLSQATDNLAKAEYHSSFLTNDSTYNAFSPLLPLYAQKVATSDCHRNSPVIGLCAVGLAVASFMWSK